MSWSAFVNMGWRRQAWLVMAVAFSVRFGYVWATGQLGAMPPSFSEQVRMARYLVHGTGFVSPVGPERHDPSSWYAPGYVAAVALAFEVCGEDTPTAFGVIRTADLLAQACAIAIWVVIGRYLLGRRVAALGAVFMVASPAISLKAGEIWDTFPTMLGGAVCLAMFMTRRLRRRRSQFLAGAVCGLVAMVNPCFTACYPVWVIWKVWRRDWGSQRLGRIGLQIIYVLLGFVVVILPWTVRNRVVFGEWFYLRGNMGLEMWVGNAPWSDGYFHSVQGPRVHPVFEQGETDRLVERGEFGYFTDRMAEVKQWVGEDPLRVAGLMLRRVGWFWLGHYSEALDPLRRVLKFVGFTLPGVLAVAGCIHGLIWRPRSRVLVATLLVFPIPYYLSVMMVRYRLPAEPICLLMAALIITHTWRRTVGRRHGDSA